MNNSKSKNKSQKRKRGKRIFITLLCLLVLAALGLSIAGNVLQYQKWKALSSAPTLGDNSGQPDVEPPADDSNSSFKPLDSVTPISLRAGSAGQHLYINTDEETLNAVKAYSDERDGGFLLAAFPNQHNGAIDLYEIFAGESDCVFFVIFDSDRISIMFMNEDKGIIYDYSTKVFGDSEESILSVSETGQIAFGENALEALGFETVYFYPLINGTMSDDFEGDFDSDYLWGVEEINKLFAFSPFGNQ